jgi:hypothetical protein
MQYFFCSGFFREPALAMSEEDFRSVLEDNLIVDYFREIGEGLNAPPPSADDLDEFLKSDMPAIAAEVRTAKKVGYKQLDNMFYTYVDPSSLVTDIDGADPLLVKTPTVLYALIFTYLLNALGTGDWIREFESTQRIVVRGIAQLKADMRRTYSEQFNDEVASEDEVEDESEVEYESEDEVIEISEDEVEYKLEDDAVFEDEVEYESEDEVEYESEDEVEYESENEVEVETDDEVDEDDIERFFDEWMRNDGVAQYVFDRDGPPTDEDLADYKNSRTSNWGYVLRAVSEGLLDMRGPIDEYATIPIGRGQGDEPIAIDMTQMDEPISTRAEAIYAVYIYLKQTGVELAHVPSDDMLEVGRSELLQGAQHRRFMEDILLRATQPGGFSAWDDGTDKSFLAYIRTQFVYHTMLMENMEEPAELADPIVVSVSADMCPQMEDQPFWQTVTASRMDHLWALMVSALVHYGRFSFAENLGVQGTAMRHYERGIEGLKNTTGVLTQEQADAQLEYVSLQVHVNPMYRKFTEAEVSQMAEAQEAQPAAAARPATAAAAAAQPAAAAAAQPAAAAATATAAAAAAQPGIVEALLAQGRTIFAKPGPGVPEAKVGSFYRDCNGKYHKLRRHNDGRMYYQTRVKPTANRKGYMKSHFVDATSTSATTLELTKYQYHNKATLFITCNLLQYAVRSKNGKIFHRKAYASRMSKATIDAILQEHPQVRITPKRGAKPTRALKTLHRVAKK